MFWVLKILYIGVYHYDGSFYFVWIHHLFAIL